MVQIKPEGIAHFMKRLSQVDSPKASNEFQDMTCSDPAGPTCLNGTPSPCVPHGTQHLVIVRLSAQGVAHKPGVRFDIRFHPKALQHAYTVFLSQYALFELSGVAFVERCEQLMPKKYRLIHPDLSISASLTHARAHDHSAIAQKQTTRNAHRHTAHV